MKKQTWGCDKCLKKVSIPFEPGVDVKGTDDIRARITTEE